MKLLEMLSDPFNADLDGIYLSQDLWFAQDCDGMVWAYHNKPKCNGIKRWFDPTGRGIVGQAIKVGDTIFPALVSDASTACVSTKEIIQARGRFQVAYIRTNCVSELVERVEELSKQIVLSPALLRALKEAKRAIDGQ